MKNYYDILELSPKTSISNITQKYLRFLQEFREKRNQKKYDVMLFSERAEAYFVLKNAKRKSIYNRLYAIHFENKDFLNPKTQAKWESMIQKASIQGKNYAQYLIESDDAELRRERRRRKGRSKSFLRSIIEFMVEAIFSNLPLFS
ncbi:MAG: hypothetical protein MI810_23305 [Flavobacteriales bacterium]|nr:hypothetical protein [Flavobacteriales bacterium]